MSLGPRHVFKVQVSETVCNVPFWEVPKLEWTRYFKVSVFSNNGCPRMTSVLTCSLRASHDKCWAEARLAQYSVIVCIDIFLYQNSFFLFFLCILFVAEVSIFTVEGVCMHPESRHAAIKWAPTDALVESAAVAARSLKPEHSARARTRDVIR